MYLRRRWIIAICLPLFIICAIGIYRMSKPESLSGKLRAEIIVSKADLGIPGITKTYEGKIKNLALLPVSVTRCDFIDDASAPGTMVAYAVQRWEPSLAEWKTVVASGEGFCRPYPLGIIRARLTTGLLWPMKNLSTGEEATAARDTFHKGDITRFVIFTSRPGDFASSITTPTFSVDEERVGPDFPARVRH
jgi:hypothetical protein